MRLIINFIILCHFPFASARQQNVAILSIVINTVFKTVHSYHRFKYTHGIYYNISLQGKRGVYPVAITRVNV